jgi:hypothetical protein
MNSKIENFVGRCTADETAELFVEAFCALTDEKLDDAVHMLSKDDKRRLVIALGFDPED